VQKLHIVKKKNYILYDSLTTLKMQIHQNKKQTGGHIGLVEVGLTASAHERSFGNMRIFKNYIVILVKKHIFT
jgi:hypothetical protein